jgi:hypothetical protein
MRASEFTINLKEYENNLLAKAFIKSLKTNVENSKKRLQIEKDRQRRQRELERQRRMAQDV